MAESLVEVLTGKCEKDFDHSILDFPFPVDHFQKYAMTSMCSGNNVLVTAHTGTGKTVVAEYAIAKTLREGKKVIYTSPIKSLSNQKYCEFKIRFAKLFEELGYDQGLGIMTGDIKLNPDAPCLIMTTEILRNALFPVKESQKVTKAIDLHPTIIDEIGCVIFDEVHYFNDFDRGHVWEETMVQLPNRIQLILLSATIKNPEIFAKWVGITKQIMISLIPTSHRVVPLRHYMFVGDGLIPMMDEHNDICKLDNAIVQANKYMKHPMHKINQLVRYLYDNDLLQCIFFVFSRKNCVKFSKKIEINLLDPKQQAETLKMFDRVLLPHRDVCSKLEQYHTLRTLVQKGIAFHHSGLIPPLKEVVEMLFKLKYVKALFATETFAVGVNMPTRTVVFTELEKFSGTGRRLLHTDEYKQMSGRAGRRGIDKTGTVVVLPLYEPPDRLNMLNLLKGELPEIKSHLRLDYQLYLNTLLTKGTDLKKFMDMSFYHKDTIKLIKRATDELDYTKEQLGLGYSENIIKETESKDFEMYHSMLMPNKSCIKLSNKQRKKFRNLKNQMEKDPDFDKKITWFKKIKKLEDDKKYLESQLDYMSKYVSIESKQLREFLIHFEYLQEPDSDGNEITTRGILASQIHECNGIIMTELIMQKLLSGLNPIELTTLLSMFVHERSKMDSLPKSHSYSYLLVSKIEKINKIIQRFVSVESSLGLKFHELGYWDICYDFMEPIIKWINCHTLQSALDCSEIYEGNFIKGVLKISNLVKDMVSLCEMTGYLEILPVLDQINPLLIHGVTAITSLYVTD
jgi:superfamily II RNA helicase